MILLAQTSFLEAAPTLTHYLAVSALLFAIGLARRGAEPHMQGLR